MSEPDYSKVENPSVEWRKEEFYRRLRLNRADFYKELLPIIQAVVAGNEVEELDLCINSPQNWHELITDVLSTGTSRYIYRIKQQQQQQQQQPKWIPWTIDTAPEELVWVRTKVNYTYRYLVTSYGPSGVTAGSGFSLPYSELLSDYEYAFASSELNKWHTCGTLTDTNENKS